MRGKLIVIEGLDGSGKATQTEFLSKKFTNNGIKFLPVSFPNYNEPSSVLIKMYLDSYFGNDPEGVNAFATSSFYAIDRFASFNRSWKKQYDQGYVILADRYTTSNAVYQLPKLMRNRWESYLIWLCDYEYDKLLLPRPDLTIYLDVPPDISQKLILSRYEGKSSKRDLHEKNIDFLNSCRKAAYFSGKRLGWKFVNCCDENGNLRSKESISYDVLNEVGNFVKIKNS
ncbi:MAG: deoxynucleoside kinase [Oscillospiraceae bacterium]|nr:deoxynucleoside kinase [Oscillospiraceae bacterium]